MDKYKKRYFNPAHRITGETAVEKISGHLVAGLRPVIEAIQSGREVEKVLIKTGLDGNLSRTLLVLLEERRIPIQFVPVEKLNRLTPNNHQGVIAFTSLIPYISLEEIIADITDKENVPLLLLLDGITDVRNFGAIARSAECAGVKALIFPAKGAAPINTDALKTSSGALSRIPVCRAPNLRTAIYYIKDSGLQIVAVSEKADTLLYDCDLRRPTALVLGAEDTGISESVLKLADQRVKIPMQGAISSLNVSAAAAVTLFEAVRQRTI